MSVLKHRARCYGYESVRNTENRAKTAILWEKQGYRGLNVINHILRGLAENSCKTHKTVPAKRI